MHRTILALAFAVVTFIVIAGYAFELWVYFTDRDNFAKRVTRKITYDETGQHAVPVWDRLLISYPLAILVLGGLATYFLLSE